MDKQKFKTRTKQLALRVIRLVNALPPGQTAEFIGKRLLRSATSIGAKYRAACHCEATLHLVAKLRIVEEKTDESLYWMELLIESELMPAEQLKSLMSETNEILAMTVASITTLTETPKSKV